MSAIFLAICVDYLASLTSDSAGTETVDDNGAAANDDDFNDDQARQSDNVTSSDELLNYFRSK